MKSLAALALGGCMGLAGCQSDPFAMPPPPLPMAMVASLNGMDIERDAANVAPWHEQALCVHASDSLIAKGDWDFMKPVSEYWTAQFTSHLPSEAERAPRMDNAAKRFAAFQPYPDAQSNLFVHIALVNRCERAMKATTGAS